MKIVAIEDIIVDTILGFCENAAELGCPKDQEVDMWFRYLPRKEQLRVADKLIEIEERDEKRFRDEDKSKLGPFCPTCNKRKMKKGELVGCKDLSKTKWDSGFAVDENNVFSQKNCPMIKTDVKNKRRPKS